MTIREIQTKGAALLSSPCPGAFIDTPALDAALLLAKTLNVRREELLVNWDKCVTENDCTAFFGLLERRKAGECVAYILGRKDFMDLDFIVNPSVLVPRPDTETLVEAALESIDNIQHEKDNFSLLDLCTGSGALAISLKKKRPFLSVSASDISAEALETAALNAKRLLDKDAVNFMESDLFENIACKFNVIVSNPPYIPSAQIPLLAPEVQREPRLALDGGEDGLYFIKKIISGARERLHPGGFLLIEADPAQMPEIKSLLKIHDYARIKTHRDLADRDRVISARSN